MGARFPYEAMKTSKTDGGNGCKTVNVTKLCMFGR